MISPDIMINRGLVALQGNPVSHVPFTHIAATSVPGWVALCAGIAPMASMALSFAVSVGLGNGERLCAKSFSQNPCVNPALSND